MSVTVEKKKMDTTRIKAKEYTKEQAKEALEKVFSEAPILQKSFGQTVEEIMRMRGLTKMWGGKQILDVPRAAELTGLNPNIFRTNMYKADCTVDMSLVVSMCIGFKLSPTLSGWLLRAAGLEYRLENPEHLAYIFLMENCQDLSIDECNEILEYLGVPKTRRLGSYHRGGSEGYRKE